MNAPIIFVGPSMSLRDARRCLDADYRRPCRRGDFESIPSGTIVGLIDGVFHQTNAIGARELLLAVKRGVRIYGSSSMGALRAVEVPGIIGVGLVYEMYKHNMIDGDDEVAVCCEPEEYRPLTVPLVNVRYAAERLRVAGTITDRVCERLIASARTLHFTQRTYRQILNHAHLGNKADAEELLLLLERFDLKKSDAERLLECISDVNRREDVGANQQEPMPSRQDDQQRHSAVRRAVSPESDVVIWEMGSTTFPEIVQFLKLTGEFDRFATDVILRRALSDGWAQGGIAKPKHGETKASFRRLCRMWGWNTTEEVRTTMDDLGLDAKAVLREIKRAATGQAVLEAFACRPTVDFMNALRVTLFSDDLSLKRMAMRWESLKSVGAPNGSHRVTGPKHAAKRTLCRLHSVGSWMELEARLNRLGLSDSDIDRFLQMITVAREKWTTLSVARPHMSRKVVFKADASIGLADSNKAEGENRFSFPMAGAFAEAKRLASVIGVTRIGMITDLADISGAHVSQVARPDGVWSSSYGSGKSTSKEGAVVGGIMEEVEKWAQEHFKGEPIVASYKDLCTREQVLDPLTLDLPYDTKYDASANLPWHRCNDLIQDEPILVPMAAIACPENAGANNVYLTTRGARTVFTTNGLASGFSFADALVHAVCEYIERHSVRMNAVNLENPGLRRPMRWPRLIDIETVGPLTQAVLYELQQRDCYVGLWDITADVKVPTCLARIFQNGIVAKGTATHPDPEVACHMALLEAVQTIVGAVAAAREDLTVQARSLGRHERSRPSRAAAELFWYDEDQKAISLSELGGLTTDSVVGEFNWIRDRLIDSGIDHIISVDMTTETIKPACVVRVVVPGLETINPFHCGHRARMALVSDLVAAETC